MINIPTIVVDAAIDSDSNIKMAETSNLEIMSTGIVSANVKPNYAREINDMIFFNRINKVL